MIILDSTTEKLQMVLSGAVATTALDWTVSYVDVTTTTYSPGNNDGTSNNTTDVDIASAPAASTQRQIKQITVYNRDTADATVTIKKDTSGTDKIFCKVTLAISDTLQYNDGEGFCIITAGGGIKNSLAPAVGISAGTQSVSTGTVAFADSNGIVWGMAGSSRITASVSSSPMSFFEVPHAAINANLANNNSTLANSSLNLSLQRVFVPHNITVTRLDLIAHLTNAGSTQGTWSISVGVYTRTQSTLNRASTTFSGLTFASGGATTNTGSYSGVSGTRIRSFAPASWAFSPGEYWFGFINSASAPAGTTPSITIYGQSSVSLLGMPGGQNDAIGQYGIFSVGTGGFPSTLNVTSDIIYCGTNASNASIVNRQPYFRMFGTY